MGCIILSLALQEQLVDLFLHLDDVICAGRPDLAFIHQSICSAYEYCTGEAPYSRRHIGRRVHHKYHIQHLVPEVQKQLPEILVVINCRMDVAPAIIPNDQAIVVILIDVLEDIILVAADFIPGSQHLPNALVKGHLFMILPPPQEE